MRKASRDMDFKGKIAVKTVAHRASEDVLRKSFRKQVPRLV